MKPVAAFIVASMLALAQDACAQSPTSAAAGDDVLAPTPTAPAIALAQRLDASLPLSAPFTDSTGRRLRLGDEFSGAPRATSSSTSATPVILVLGYYRCPQLCGLAMQGLLEAMHGTGLPTSAYRIVFASIDPADTPADASIRRRVALDYAHYLDDGAPAATPVAIDMLVGPPASIDALARSVGYTYEAAPPRERIDRPALEPARFAHPAGLVVVTPAGRVSRYLMGVRFDPHELRTALVEASDGRVGGFTDRIALMCAHLDPRAGRWSMTVLEGMRGVGIATMASLGLLLWRRRRPHPGGPD